MHARTLELRKKKKTTHATLELNGWDFCTFYLQPVGNELSLSWILKKVSVIINYKLTPSLRLDSTFFAVTQTTGTLISVPSYFP